jgi:hypothetical protein
VEDALPDAIERAIGATEMWKFDRNRVLRVRVFAAATLEDELDLDLVLFPLLEVNDRRARPEVVAGIAAGDGVDRVRPQLPSLGRFSNRFANLLTHPDLIGSDRDLDFERRHAGVLANRAFGVDGQVDVLCDDRQGL